MNDNVNTFGHFRPVTVQKLNKQIVFVRNFIYYSFRRFYSFYLKR